ncbi:MAG: hypothetical protein GY772_18070, partial [bacterium]|nr:hypothetical protein [bacterium]
EEAMPPRFRRAQAPAGLAAAAPAEEQPTLWRVLAKRFLLGQLQAPAVVEIAAAAATDAGPTGGCSVRRLAQLKHLSGGSLHRAVRRQLQQQLSSTMPPAYMVELPISKKRGGTTVVEQVSWPLLLPLFKLPSIITSRKRLRDFTLGESDEGARKRNVRRWCERMQQEGLKQHRADDVVLLGLYADGAPGLQQEQQHLCAEPELSASRPASAALYRLPREEP